MQKNLEKIFAYVDENFDSMLEELKELCSYRSVSGDQEGLEGSRQWITKRLEQAGIPWKLHPVEGGNALISASCTKTEEEERPCVLFYNHYDVVEEGKRERWSSDPFQVEIRDGYMYGRGISDNKGPLLARIQAVEAIRNVCGELPVDVRFLFEGDEEISSPSMAAFCRQHEKEFQELTKADACFWENGRRDEKGRPWARFGVRGNISFTLSVETSSKDVHARMGTTVPSASWRLIWALASLKGADERITIEGFYDDVRPVTKEDEEVLEAFPYEEKKQLEKLGLSAFLKNATGLELKKQVYMEPSLSVCGLEAGELYNGPRNIVPHKATAKIAFYLVANQTPEKVAKQLREHLDKHGFSDVQIQAKGGNTPVRTPVNIPLRDILVRSAAKVYEEPMVIEPTALGGGPVIYFHRAWPKMPIVGVGPGNTSGNHHAPDENLKVEDYKASLKYMIALLFEMANSVTVNTACEP